MAEGSYLRRRRAELMEGEPAVPIDYETLRDRAADHLPRGPYDYVAGGAGSEGTVSENRAAFRRHRILPRVLRDVSTLDLSTELFGGEIPAPLMLAPIGGQRKYHAEGELATARAAGEVGIPMALSTTASHSIEAVAEAKEDGPLLFQLYWPRDWDVAESFVRRAEAAGYDGVVLTVDSKLSKWRMRNLRNAYRGSRDAPKAIFESDPVVKRLAEAADRSVDSFVHESPALEDDPSIDWEDLDALREWTDLPVVLKGVLHPEDARRAVEWGADGIVVSNHGGRQIDGEVTAIGQLPAVVEAVDGEATVILDSGVRSGADAFKAVALGADLVQFGRPYVFGLAIAGQRGVEEVVLNLLAELESVVGLSGYGAIERVTEEAVLTRS